MTEAEFREHVRALVAGTCGSTAALARKHGIHPKALTLFLSGARGPSAEVSAAFGFERRYVPLADAILSSTPVMSGSGECGHHAWKWADKGPSGTRVCTLCGTILAALSTPVTEAAQEQK